METRVKYPGKSLYNSSLTRVYPLFGRLIAQDPSGKIWLPNILQLAIESAPQALPVPKPIGSLLPEVVAKRTISGNALKYHGVETIDLPRCFEKAIPSSYRFLRWLIEHPERLIWPANSKTLSVPGRRANAKTCSAGMGSIDRLPHNVKRSMP